jgi:predicted ATPase
LRGELEEVGDAKFLPRFLLPLGEFAAGLGKFGDVAQGLAIVEETLTRCEVRHEGWYLPELLRIKGELLLKEAGDRSTLPAERCFGASLELARQQTTLFWELRSALSLARLRINQDRQSQAQYVLAPVLDKFTEGFAIADMRAGRALLETLA